MIELKKIAKWKNLDFVQHFHADLWIYWWFNGYSCFYVKSWIFGQLFSNQPRNNHHVALFENQYPITCDGHPQTRRGRNFLQAGRKKFLSIQSLTISKCFQWINFLVASLEWDEIAQCMNLESGKILTWLEWDVFDIHLQQRALIGLKHVFGMSEQSRQCLKWKLWRAETSERAHRFAIAEAPLKS